MRTFSRTPVRRVWVLRDQYVLGIRQFVPVLVNEYDDGTLLQGTERCQYVISGDPYAKCKECDERSDYGTIVPQGCPHLPRVTRCGRRAWYESRRFGHTVCEDHRD